MWLRCLPEINRTQNDALFPLVDVPVLTDSNGK